MLLCCGFLKSIANGKRANVETFFLFGPHAHGRADEPDSVCGCCVYGGLFSDPRRRGAAAKNGRTRDQLGAAGGECDCSWGRV